MLIIRGVNVFPSQIEAALSTEARLAPHYVLEVTRPERLDELTVVVESRPETAGELTSEMRLALEHRAEHLIKALVGVTTTVRVVPPSAIERPSGVPTRPYAIRCPESAGGSRIARAMRARITT